VICRFYFSPLLAYEAIFRKALRVSIASESQTLSWQHTLNIAPIRIHHLHINHMHLTLLVLSHRARAACRGTSTASGIPAVAVEPASPLRIVSNCTVNNYPGSGRTLRAGSPASSSAAAAPSRRRAVCGACSAMTLDARNSPSTSLRQSTAFDLPGTTRTAASIGRSCVRSGRTGQIHLSISAKVIASNVTSAAATPTIENIFEHRPHHAKR
jgi:hypothetical protein